MITFIALSIAFLLVLLALVLRWQRPLVRALRRMDSLDRREAPDPDYGDAMSRLRAELAPLAARLRDPDCASRRRYLGLFREVLLDIAQAPDPLAREAWSLATGRPCKEWAGAFDDETFHVLRREHWEGVYLYEWTPGQEHAMQMMLSLHDGRIRGSGRDDVGNFDISGHFSGEDAFFFKRYRTHTVEYRGTYRGNSISGIWTLPGACGEFQLWRRA